MGVVTGIIVFLLIWWTALFAILPFGHKRDDDGTPVKPNMKRKLLWTTLMAIILWGMVFALINAQLVSFRDIANHMIEEDYGE